MGKTEFWQWTISYQCSNRLHKMDRGGTRTEIINDDSKLTWYKILKVNINKISK